MTTARVSSLASLTKRASHDLLSAQLVPWMANVRRTLVLMIFAAIQLAPEFANVATVKRTPEAPASAIRPLQQQTQRMNAQALKAIAMGRVAVGLRRDAFSVTAIHPAAFVVGVTVKAPVTSTMRLTKTVRAAKNAQRVNARTSLPLKI